MPGHNCDLNDPKSVLRILLALTVKNGGELRVKASMYDSLDRGRLLLVDFDKRRGDILLRATSDFGRVAVVTPEAVAWSAPIDTAPMERARVAAVHAAEERSLPNDEQLAELEEKLAAQKQVADDVASGVAPMRIRVKK